MLSFVHRSIARTIWGFSPFARCPDAERFEGNTQPSCLASHLSRRIAKTRPLIGTSRRPSAVLLSGTKITRFCQSKFSIRIRKSSLSFLIPVSRIKMTMSRKSSRVLGRQLQAKAPIISFLSFLSASSSSRRFRPVFFHHFDFRSVADHLPLLRFVQHSSQCSQSAVCVCSPARKLQWLGTISG